MYKRKWNTLEKKLFYRKTKSKGKISKDLRFADLQSEKAGKIFTEPEFVNV
jgi:hypothetical protein